MRQIKRKTLLYKSKVEYADWAINHVQGCAHDCRFPCYAYNQARYSGRVKNHADWRNVALVSNALELLDKEIPKYKDQIKEVHLCFVTDPFMYNINSCDRYDGQSIELFPEIVEMTLAIIHKLNQADIKVTTLTKGWYPIDEVLELGEPAKRNEYGITLVSTNDVFHDKYEPGAAYVDNRLASLEFVHEGGFNTWASLEPYPTPNLDPEGDLDALLETVSFVDKIVFGRWNYNSAVRQYPDWEQFYNECADKVIEFCKDRDIEYWIKDGTQTKAVSDVEVT